MGNVTRHEYNGQHQLVKTVYPDGSCMENTLDARDRVVKIKNRDGSVTGREYDLDGKVTATIRADGRRSENGYNADGRLIWTKDFNGNVTSFEHDDWGNVVKATDAIGNATRAAYDLAGRRVSATDAMGRTVKFVYDQRGRLVSQTDALGNVTKTAYDLAGNRIALTDANGNVSTWKYDVMNRPVSLTYPNGDTEKYAYDMMGRLDAKTLPDGSVVKYAYELPGVSKISTKQGDIDYTYDAYGRLVAETDHTLPGGQIGKVSYEYDNFGRMIACTDHNLNQTVKYSYDVMNRRTQTALGDKTISYSYNVNGWLEKVRKSGESSPAVYEYNANGQRTKLILPNGVVTAYAYDAAGRLLSVTSKNPAGAILCETVYTLDATGNRTAMRLTMDGKTQIARYNFDNNSQLTGETRTLLNPQTHAETPLFSDVFTYDKLGNRLTRTHVASDGQSTTTRSVYNNANQLLTETSGTAVKTYAYDKNGNIIAIVENGKTITMEYDWLNRQTKWTDGTNTESTVYRGAGWKRIASTVSGTGITERIIKYLYDSDNVLADFDGSNQQSAFYVAPMLDQNVSVTNAQNSAYYYTHDGLGSIRNLTDATGNAVNNYDYTAFGETNPEFTAETVTNRYTYTGREKSPLVDAPMYHRWRNYSPTLGRFVVRDPLLYSDINNIYLYTNNMPGIAFDSYGTFSIVEAVVVVAMVGILVAAIVVPKKNPCTDADYGDDLASRLSSPLNDAMNGVADAASASVPTTSPSEALGGAFTGSLNKAAINGATKQARRITKEHMINAVKNNPNAGCCCKKYLGLDCDGDEHDYACCDGSKKSAHSKSMEYD